MIKGITLNTCRQFAGLGRHFVEYLLLPCHFPMTETGNPVYRRVLLSRGYS